MRPSKPEAIWSQALLPSAAVVAIGLIIGCGPNTPAGKVKLTGTVTCDGKLLEGGVINFVAKQGTANGSAGISQKGGFTVFLVPGEYDVAVRDNSGMRPPDAANGPPIFIPRVVPERFTSADSSGLSVTAAAAADSKPVTIALESE
ncbi:MAG: hypothetical protein WCH77_13130 [Planctomycetota bacterium]